jgi:hypothetical protein
MRARPLKAGRRTTDFAGQKKVATDTAFTISSPSADKLMILPPQWQRAIILNQSNHHLREEVHAVVRDIGPTSTSPDWEFANRGAIQERTKRPGYRCPAIKPSSGNPSAW